MLALPLTYPILGAHFLFTQKAPCRIHYRLRCKPFFRCASNWTLMSFTSNSALRQLCSFRTKNLDRREGFFQCKRAVGAWGNPGCRKGYIRVCVCVIYYTCFYMYPKNSGSFFENGKLIDFSYNFVQTFRNPRRWKRTIVRRVFLSTRCTYSGCMLHHLEPLHFHRRSWSSAGIPLHPIGREESTALQVKESSRVTGNKPTFSSVKTTHLLSCNSWISDV